MDPGLLRNKSLLVGNGPNLLTVGQLNWQNILKQLAIYASDRDVLKSAVGKPFPLLYEELAIRCMRRGVLESDLKKHVAILMKEMVPNNFHGRLIGLGFNHVLTTNYDYCLERASKKPAKVADLSAEKRYNLYRRRCLDGKYVWHIHGEIDRPRTITLGYDHYVGYLAKLKEYLVFEGKEIESTDKHSTFIRGHKNFEEGKNPCYSWVDIFLRDDIYIIGLSLDYSEIDLWWLLVFKERQRLRAKKRSAAPTIGNTVFYYIFEQRISMRDKARLSLLDSIGIETVTIQCDRGYERAYHAVLNHIVSHRVRRRRRI